MIRYAGHARHSKNTVLVIQVGVAGIKTIRHAHLGWTRVMQNRECIEVLVGGRCGKIRWPKPCDDKKGCEWKRKKKECMKDDKIDECAKFLYSKWYKEQKGCAWNPKYRECESRIR